MQLSTRLKTVWVATNISHIEHRYSDFKCDVNLNQNIRTLTTMKYPREEVVS